MSKRRQQPGKKSSEKEKPVSSPANASAKQPRKQGKRSRQFSKPSEQPRAEYRAKHISRQRLPGHCPLVLENSSDDAYSLLDSGNGLKLERYGNLRIIRPEAQAIWQPSLDPEEWKRADAVFTGDTNEEGAGRWAFPHGEKSETWPMSWDNLRYLGRFTSFRHVGVFPEQAAHWRFMEERIGDRVKAGSGFELLNLFGYTGLASLVAARAGARVTHVDASKKAIGWARENQELAGLEDRPVRWICEDAMRFCEREARRGNRYDGILLDPPHYGRGPKGEVWQLFEDLPRMLDVIRDLTDGRSSFVILTAYAIRASFYSMHEIMQEKFGDCGGVLESGELVLKTENGHRHLSTSLFSRWCA